MKIMSKTLAAPTVILALLICVSALLAQEHMRAGTERLSHYLALTAEQTASIDQEVENFEKTHQSVFVKLGQYEGQMEKAVQSGDATTVGRLYLDRVALNRQIAEDRKELQNRIRSILTPQQVEKLDQAREVLRYSPEGASLLGPLFFVLEEGAGKKSHGGGMMLRHLEEPIR